MIALCASWVRGLARAVGVNRTPRLARAKPACAGATLRVRAEALPERAEAPAGL